MSNEIKAVADTFMEDVIEFLEEEADEDDDKDLDDVKPQRLASRIRTFGGVEWRGTN
jgi:hypothetical protein